MLVLLCILNVILIIVIFYLLRYINFPFCKHEWQVTNAYSNTEIWSQMSRITGTIVPGSEYNRFLITAELKCIKSNCNKIRTVSGYEDENYISKEDMAKIQLFLNKKKEMENGK